MANGLPNILTLAVVGGAKTDYAPVEDATTDLSAAELNYISSGVAGLSYTGCRAWRRSVTANTSTPTDPASNAQAHGAMWGNAVGVKPVVARTGVGVFTVTWTATQTDLLNVSQTLALFTGWGNAESGTFYHVQVRLTSVNVATVCVFQENGTAVESTDVTIFVGVI